MAIYLSRKKGGAIATPITPSNASPAQLTANVAVNPTANGYAIESYTEVVPSNASPATLSNGSIYKIKTNGGKAVASITDVTPSSTPTSVSANDVVKIGGSGVIVDSIPTPTSLTPSNSNPATITSGETYTATANGKAVSNILSPTPSDSNPPHLNNTSTVYKVSASGYLYSSSGLKKVKTGTFQTSTSGEVTVTLGFQPKYLAFEGDGSTSSGKHFMYIYNADTSTSVCYFANASNYPTTRSMTSVLTILLSHPQALSLQ